MVLVKEMQNSECHELYQITNYCPNDQTLTCHHFQLPVLPFKKQDITFNKTEGSIPTESKQTLHDTVIFSIWPGFLTAQILKPAI